MVEARENPLGVERFEFIEFASPEPEKLHELFGQMGFSPVARHKARPITLYRQGDINLLVNETHDSFASDFAAAHGPCCPGFALKVDDADAAYQAVKAKGAEDITHKPETLAINSPRIKGIGDSALYLVSGLDDLMRHFDPIPGADQHPKGYGLTFIDHLTHNVINGNMAQWAEFYSNLFNFFQVKYFDIRGSQTGLRSQAMTAPNGKISIPINESEDPKSQINEYLDEYKGEGVQHIALYTENIYETVESMHSAGVKFLDSPPDTYYNAVDERIPGHGEDVERMQKNAILIDAEPDNPNLQLLQIFTKTNIGPIFFEVIQRKGNEGFGEGNFKALFEAIERDQEKRGVL